MSEKKKILIVDDDIDFMFLTKKKLEYAGYEVSTADNGRMCLKMAYQAKPDIILLDIMLEHEDGFNVRSLIRSELSFANIPILFITAHKELEPLLRLRQQSVPSQEFIYKGCSTGELINKIESTMNKK
ncbi:MAG: response regulator [Candidatus Omnitrophica bacterium]|nr:response regulator [Candidatus Omnitrophota bacterium]